MHFQAIFLDDIGENLRPAREMGMATILVRDTDTVLKELEQLSGVQVRGVIWVPHPLLSWGPWGDGWDGPLVQRCCSASGACVLAFGLVCFPSALIIQLLLPCLMM